MKLKKDLIFKIKIKTTGYVFDKICVVFTNNEPINWIVKNLPSQDINSDAFINSAGLTMTYKKKIYVIITNHNKMINYDTLQHELFHTVLKIVQHNFGIISIDNNEETAARLIGPISTTILKKLFELGYELYFEPNSDIKLRF